MACFRAALPSLSVLGTSAGARPEVESACSGSLQAGQRLAKPGLSGLSSNSSEQMAQILIGNGMRIYFTENDLFWVAALHHVKAAHATHRLY
jgi:hypothetical protein